MYTKRLRPHTHEGVTVGKVSEENIGLVQVLEVAFALCVCVCVCVCLRVYE